MEKNLTTLQAYKVMLYFLEKLYDENPYHELGGILGSMRLLDDNKPGRGLFDFDNCLYRSLALRLSEPSHSRP